MSVREILEKVAKGEMSVGQASKDIKTSKNTAKPKTLYCKKSDKGCICFYGLRKLPISLYPKELKSILDYIQTEEFHKFAESNNVSIYYDAHDVIPSDTSTSTSTSTSNTTANSTTATTSTSNDQILMKVALGEIDVETAEKMMNNTSTKISVKLSEKGCLCFYGLRKMPISLFPEELQQIMSYVKDESFEFKADLV